MQNPVNKVISFKGVSRHCLHNGNLSYLADYFSEKGEHLFGEKVTQLTISNMQLTDVYRNSMDQMPSGVPCIIKLITKNPNISCLDLSNTGLGNQAALALLKALEENTKLEMLNLSGNHIDEKYLKELDKKLIAKFSVFEIRKNARVLHQASRSGFFATFPEINIKIAAHTGSPLSHQEPAALAIAEKYYCRP